MRKMVKSIGLIAIFICLGALSTLMAQTVTGKVTSGDDNTPLQTVSVRNKNSKVKVSTNDKGEYSIAAGANDVLVFSFGGYKTKEVPVGGKTKLDVVLNTANTELGAVVVTALDIKRNPKEVTYAVQNVSGKDIVESQRDNFLNALQGRVAGVTINQTSGVAGSSSAIVLRGFNSVSGNNQPLFIIDGVILSNETFDEQGGYGLASDRPNRANDYQNRIADLNPNDIENVVVLKGPEAAALYGSQASAGAIIITMKKAKTADKRYVKFNYDNVYRTSYLTRFPETQTVYASGINGQGLNSTSAYGPKFAPGTKVYDNVRNFFRPGLSMTNNFGVDLGNDKVALKYVGSVLDQRGVVYSNDFLKTTGRISATFNALQKQVEFTPSVFYSYFQNNKPLRGASSYMASLMLWRADDDVRKYELSGLSQYLDDGETFALFENPFFATLYNRNFDQNTRLTYSTGVNIKPKNLKWLTINGRFGLETSNQKISTLYHPNSFRSEGLNGGFLDISYPFARGYNHNITVSAKKEFGDFTLGARVGQTFQSNRREIISVSGANIRNINIIDSSQILGNRLRLQRNNDKGLPQLINFSQAAILGEITANYKQFIFANATIRAESSSTLPAKNRNYSYPSFGASFVFSELVKESKILSYGKLRATYAQTARINPPYSNQSRIQNPATTGFPAAAQGFTANNPDLSPERQKTYEYGIELKLFKNRVGFDVTYFNTNVSNLILENFRASFPAIGSVLATINGGDLTNRGVEAVIDLVPIKTKNFSWNFKANFAKNLSKVNSLPGAVPEFYISDAWLAGNVRNGIVKGGTTTTITGFAYRRNNRGDVLIDPTTGFPLTNTDQWVVLGDRLPDYRVGFTNSFKYKNWGLNFLWDLKVGGDIYNATDWINTTSYGKSMRTLNREQPRIVKGVLRDGLENSSNPTVNNIVVTPYTNSAYWSSLGPEEYIEKDVNWFMLKDVTLTYTFGNKFINKLKFFKTLSAFATVTDLWLFTNYSGADPQVNGNTPATKGVGAFGFDYLNVGTPVGVNFGLRTSF